MPLCGIRVKGCNSTLPLFPFFICFTFQRERNRPTLVWGCQRPAPCPMLLSGYTQYSAELCNLAWQRLSCFRCGGPCVPHKGFVLHLYLSLTVLEYLRFHAVLPPGWYVFISTDSRSFLKCVPIPRRLFSCLPKPFL